MILQQKREHEDVALLIVNASVFLGCHVMCVLRKNINILCFCLYNMDSISAFETLVALHLVYCTMLLSFDTVRII